MKYILETLPVGQIAANCYIFGCANTKEAVIIDPGAVDGLIKKRISALGLKPVYVINTHGHGDHIGANSKMGLPILIHAADAQYLVNPPATDPFPSPTIKARHVIDTQQHAFAGVNVYSVAFKAVDDDGGRSSDGVHTVILGNAPLASGVGYWRHQLLGDGTMSAGQLSSYLKVVGYMSAFFNESRDASTPSQASAIITGPPRFGDVKVTFDQQLLAVWLNFANGSIHYLKMIDTNGDGVDDTTFAKFVSHAEALRMNPATTRTQLLKARNLLEEINTGAE